MADNASVQGFKIKFRTETIELELPASLTVGDLRAAIAEATGVAPHAQKLMGLAKKKKDSPDDDVVLSSLPLKSPTHKLMLVGTTEEELVSAVAIDIVQSERVEAERAAEEAAAAKAEDERIRREIAQAEAAERAQERREEEAAEREALRLQRQAEREAPDPNAKINTTLKALSATLVGRGEVETGNKVILPPELLEEMQRKRIAFPLEFAVTHTRRTGVDGEEATTFKTYAAVLEFTAEAGTAIVPAPMMSLLSCGEEDTLRFRSVTLPKADFVQFAPLRAAWLQVPASDVEAVLHTALGSAYTLISVGETVVATYRGVRHELLVVDVQPGPAASLLDTDVSVDVIEPQEDVFAGTSLGLGADGSVEGCVVAPGEYERFVFQDRRVGTATFRVSVDATAGDPDVYISASIAAPEPTHEGFTWAGTDAGSTYADVGPSSEGDDGPLPQGAFYGNTLFIGVTAYGDEPAAFSLSIEEIDPSAEAGHVLAAESSATPMQTSDSVVCGNCRQAIAASTYAMHELSCARHTFRCDQCGRAMPRASQEKHLSLWHRPIICDCGSEEDAFSIRAHKTVDCPLRLVKCLYCPLRLPLAGRGDHQHTCGARTTNCTLCGERMARKNLRYHLITRHGVAEDVDPFADNPETRLQTPTTPKTDFGAAAAGGSGGAPFPEADE